MDRIKFPIKKRKDRTKFGNCIEPMKTANRTALQVITGTEYSYFMFNVNTGSGDSVTVAGLRMRTVCILMRMRRIATKVLEGKHLAAWENDVSRYVMTSDEVRSGQCPTV